MSCTLGDHIQSKVTIKTTMNTFPERRLHKNVISWNIRVILVKVSFVKPGQIIESPLCARSAYPFRSSAATFVERCSSVCTSISVCMSTLCWAHQMIYRIEIWHECSPQHLFKTFFPFFRISNFAPVYPQGPKRGLKLTQNSRFSEDFNFSGTASIHHP